MALVVEDGSGKIDAESYISVVDFKDYCDKVGLVYGSATNLEIEQAARRGTTYIEGRLQNKSRGYKRISTQALGWPRGSVVDDDGFSVPYNVLPKKLIWATAEATFRELKSANSLTPDFVAAKSVKRKVVGPLEKEFFSGGTAASVTPVVGVIDSLLESLTRVNVSSYVGSVTRG